VKVGPSREAVGEVEVQTDWEEPGEAKLQTEEMEGLRQANRWLEAELAELAERHSAVCKHLDGCLGVKQALQAEVARAQEELLSKQTEISQWKRKSAALESQLLQVARDASQVARKSCNTQDTLHLALKHKMAQLEEAKASEARKPLHAEGRALSLPPPSSLPETDSSPPGTSRCLVSLPVIRTLAPGSVTEASTATLPLAQGSHQDVQEAAEERHTFHPQKRTKNARNLPSARADEAQVLGMQPGELEARLDRISELARRNLERRTQSPGVPPEALSTLRDSALRREELPEQVLWTDAMETERQRMLPASDTDQG